MSPIIKCNGRGIPQRATFRSADLATSSDATVLDAQTLAEQILAAAGAEADSIRQRAEQEGRAAGLAEAEQRSIHEVNARVDALAPVLEKMAEEVSQARQVWSAHWEKQAVHLATAIARRLIRRELQRQPDIPLALVAEALEMVAGKPDIRILLNPEDHRNLGEQAQRLAADLTRTATTQIFADSSVTRGGCRVETRHGVIDQTIEAQLDRIEQELA